MIIGISGKLYSGKDTLAGLLVKEFSTMNVSFQLKSFAYKLKKVGAYLTNTPEEWWFTQEGKQMLLTEWGMTIGQFQQKLGTEAMRNSIHQEGWILSLMSDYGPREDWIVTDVRFPNEAEAIKKTGGVLIRIEGDPTGSRKTSKRDLNHPSETSLDQYGKFDYMILNSLPISSLELQAKNIALHLRQTGKI
jgi:hypothetical protein